MKIGITGQAGFIGTHLFNHLKTKKDVTLVTFEDSFFSTPDKLKEFVKECDTIVHLAAVNRCDSQEELYETNLRLINQLIGALETTGATPHVIFSSSTQEDRDNFYGKSKREGRELLFQWAQKNDALFTGLIIPNVYGAFGKPFYNSVISTFCYQLTHGEQPKIDIDGLLKLIYVGEVTEHIYQTAISGKSQKEFLLPHTAEKKVSEILQLLEIYKNQYFEQGIIPAFSSSFEINLFNTFRSYINLPSHFPVLLKKNADERGVFVETVKLHCGGQISFSTTKSGITRGNHYHTRKMERFVVLQGEARIQLRKIGSDSVLNFFLSGNNPGYVDMPIWYTHNITNIGKTELITQFWINEMFDPNDPDSYFEVV
ncbi:epimerase [Bacteroidia bacterium]|nr:epimerase [Bacteroidia bacterium]